METTALVNTILLFTSKHGILECLTTTSASFFEAWLDKVFMNVIIWLLDLRTNISSMDDICHELYFTLCFCFGYFCISPVDAE